MLPFTAALDAFHARTAPSDWLEGLVKAYVGDGIAADFYRAVAELVNPQTRDLVLRVLADTGHAEFVIARVRAAIAADPQVAGRLALWARRLVGEALGQAYRVVADRRPLATLLSAGSAAAAAASPAPDRAAAGQPAADSDLGDIGRMLARITDSHAQRMAALGLAPSCSGRVRGDVAQVRRGPPKAGARRAGVRRGAAIGGSRAPPGIAQRLPKPTRRCSVSVNSM